MKKKTIKQPSKKLVKKVPVIMQMEVVECGAACLCMILAYYGKWVPLEQMRIDCSVSRDGSNARNLLIAARGYGMNAQGYRYEIEALKEDGQFPCIIHWNFDHFVVLKGFKNNKAYLNDPARGECVVTMEEFDKAFTGICLLFEPNEAFEPGGKPKSVMDFAARRLKGAKAAIAFVVLTTLISSLLSIIQPAFSRIFLDRLLTHKNPEWFLPFIIALASLSVVQLIISAAQTVYSLRINGKMAVVGNTTFLWKVLHLPMEFFAQRMEGDIQNRQNANGTVAMSLVQTFAPLVLNAFMTLFYLVVMLRYSVLLTMIGLFSIVVDLFMARIISNKRINVTRVQTRDAAQLSSATLAGIEMIETIKSSGAENGFFGRWSGYQASVNAQSVKFARLNVYLGLIPSLVSTLTSTTILMLGVWLTIKGSFTVGMIMAFQGFLSAFTSPASSLISAGQTLQEMRTQMERIEDVMKYPEDPMTKAKGPENETYAKLSGKLELKNVTFGYSRMAPALIENFNLTLEPGKRVALVGGSGCGKSTLSKLISGLYEPWSGEILFDGKPICQIDRSVFTGSLAVVDQNIILFKDTIANNIKMWDDSIEDFEMILAARDAQLHEDIMKRDGGYQHMLTENGKNLSGGQRQRMEIARVLAQDPTILILDEATSALDAVTEQKVVNAIKDRGIACIVIAHRLSTIRDCDEIIVLNQGKVVERGTHDELYKKGGVYAELISNE